MSVKFVANGEQVGQGKSEIEARGSLKGHADHGIPKRLPDLSSPSIRSEICWLTNRTGTYR
jgi:hypothetical protein